MHALKLDQAEVDGVDCVIPRQQYIFFSVWNLAKIAVVPPVPCHWHLLSNWIQMMQKQQSVTDTYSSSSY